MLVYDITDKESFDKLGDWLIEVEKNAPSNVYKILIGNKSDLGDQRQVTYDQGKEFADTYEMKFIETSAKSSLNVEDAFTTMTKEIITLKKKSVEQEDSKKKNLINFNDSKNIQKQEKGCCK